jgi:hypothetical protein
MTDFDKEEFWRALGRLYDSTVKLNEAVEGLVMIVEKHEKRLDRSEIIIEAILEDLKRHREGPNPQPPERQT